jgi:predicted secreted protein
MLRSKKVIVVSHCLLNQNAVVLPLGRAKGGFPIAKALLDEGIGIIQLPCPEFKFLGPTREPMSKEQYNSVEYRELCKRLFQPVLEDLKKYLDENYSIVGIIGINESPTCSISNNRGIFMEEIFSILDKEGIKVDYFEIPTDYTENDDFSDLYEKLIVDLKLTSLKK